MNFPIPDILFLLTLLLLALVPRTKRLWKIAFWVIFFANLGIRIYFIHNSHVLKRELQEAKDVAKPPTLSPSVKQIDRTNYGYKVLLQFAPSKNEPLGALSFSVNVLEPSSAKVVAIARRNLTTGDQKKISADGRHATISFSLLGVQRPVIELQLSEACIVGIEGSHLARSFTLEVK